MTVLHPDTTITEAGVAITGADAPSYDSLLAEVGHAHNEIELLTESVADLELAAEDRGWRRAAFELEHEFSREGLNQVAANCRVMAIASPLTKRALQLRIGYVWGQGVTVQGRATGTSDTNQAEQDVNAVVQAFWDDESNQAAFTSSQAQEENERALGTDGNLCFALFTDPLTGRVQVRSTPFEEITDKITNPQDRDEPWFYLRQYDTTVLRAFQPAAGPRTTRARAATVRVLHPALGYRPATRPRSIDLGQGPVEILWDAPMLHVPVNRLDGWKWGIPDAYAAIPWARAYDGFLTDWARLVKALSKFAWRLTGDKSSKVRSAAAKARALPVGVPGPRSLTPGAVGESEAGGVAAMSGLQLEAIPKTGATVDSESGRPLAAMVAAAFGVPVTMLLADPGTTGNRATAETLDKPTILEMGMRRALWTSVIQTVCGYVVDQAVKAPRGPLRGTMTRDASGREVAILAGDTERTVVVDWPDLNQLDPVQLVTAIVAADGTGKMPPVETLRLLLHALRVKDVDEVIETMVDDDGQWIDPEVTAAEDAVRRARQGGDTP